MAMLSAIPVSLEKCPRCNLSHLDLPVRKFRQPSLEWCAWGICPITLEPVMFQLTLDEKLQLQSVEDDREKQLRKLGWLKQLPPMIAENI
jgi:hypothetical protein